MFYCPKRSWTWRELECFVWRYPTTETRQLASELGKTVASLRHVASRMRLRKGRPWKEGQIAELRKIRHPFLSKPRTLCYLLGVIFGDGYVGIIPHEKHHTYVASFNITNRTFAESIRDAIARLGIRSRIDLVRKVAPRKDIIMVRLFNKDLVCWVKELDLTRLEELLSEQENIIAFLRGFYESEGSFVKSRNRKWVKSRQAYREWIRKTITISNGSKQLCELVFRLLKRMGFNPIFRWGNRAWEIRLLRKEEIDRFLQLVKPCIKYS